MTINHKLRVQQEARHEHHRRLARMGQVIAIGLIFGLLLVSFVAVAQVLQ